MAQLGLERVLEPQWLDEVFEEYRGRQYQRELLFSTVVDVVALVALAMQPSVHAAARSREDLRVSLSALYDKINRAEPALGERDAPLPAKPAGSARVVDGNTGTVPKPS